MMVSANSAIWVPAEPMVAGPEPLEEQHHLLVDARPGEPRQHALARRIAADQQELQKSGEQHAPGRGMPGGREKRRQRQGHHHRQVEQDRRRGGRGEAIQRIEDAAVERDEADQQQIGERDPREIDRKREAARVLAESGRQQIDHPGREQRAPRASSTTWLAASSVKTRSLNSRRRQGRLRRGRAHRPE